VSKKSDTTMKPANGADEARGGRSAPKRPCPTCGTIVDWSRQADYRPFCSKRCRLIDLGEWASDNYGIPSSEPGNEPAGDPEAGFGPATNSDFQ
jgi:endogenous inhibitor of DNA gyrase (YacG/DUF329 family)